MPLAADAILDIFREWDRVVLLSYNDYCHSVYHYFRNANTKQLLSLIFSYPSYFECPHHVATATRAMLTHLPPSIIHCIMVYNLDSYPLLLLVALHRTR